MRFSCDEFHIWYQFALSLICSEKVDGLCCSFPRLNLFLVIHTYYLYSAHHETSVHQGLVVKSTVRVFSVAVFCLKFNSFCAQ